MHLEVVRVGAPSYCVIRVEFDFPYRKMQQEPALRQIIEAAITEVLGQPIRVSFHYESKGGTP